jgi:hypothetical protein
MKKIFTIGLIILSANSMAQPVITDDYNPIFGDTYVYKIVDDTATAQPGQAGAGVIWNLTAMHGNLSTWQYNWKQTALTNGAALFGSHSNIAAEIIIPSQAPRYEYYDVGAYFDGDMKKVGTETGLAIKNFQNGYMYLNYPMSYGQNCTDTMVTDTTLSFTQGRITTTYDGYGTLQLEPQSGGNFQNVARIKVEENYEVNFGPVETHHMTTYYWFDHSTVNLTKQPIAIICIHEWIDLNGDFKRDKYGLMRQILFLNGVASLTLTSSNVNVSPNPFTGKLILSLPPVDGDVQMQICDIQGRSVKNILLEKSAASRENEIGLEELQPGIYLAKISSAQSTVIKKIIKE